MRIGVSTLFFWDYPMIEIFDILRDIGLKCIEFFPENPDFWDNRFDLDYIADLKKEFLKFDVALHNPHIELNPSSINPYIREAILKETLWSIELAKFYRCELITIHPGRRPTSRAPTDEEFEAFFKYLDKILETATNKNITICLENMPERINRIGWNPKEVEWILKKYEPLLSMTLDFAHAKHYIDEFFERTLEYIKHTHISGVVNKKDHFPLRKSEIDFSKHVRTLIDSGYRGMFNLEIDDRRLGKKEITKEEKIDELIKDVEFLENMI
ncbi:Xylose isomerase domain protein TIM barrel [Methanocaldococcus vulcanius M7]|uniref:Xylose isomerase domain protein TIM barrel n=1 Tax=Methanocaldococcus vulcanius (strain ATCC 700851 / DSM 12094 / M7) TaxID=579137 RepID=C9RDJ3_METVM|nr:sugar phosphate isomerase/epimerase [Methanocaldococcus vulcanius]ACX73372.1 Xylose isomerase domain protein TIM barrel [Methanocaldococcus vulcanius M7]